MNYRRFGRTGWQVSEIGYGMWGMGGWSNSNDDESLVSLQAAVDLGCNFFDTAYAYGQGKSEGFLGQFIRANQDKRLYTATKIPPKNLKWPALPEFTLDDCYPPDHIEEYVHKSLQNAGLESFRSDSVSHLGRLMGRRRSLGAEDVRAGGAESHSSGRD